MQVETQEQNNIEYTEKSDNNPFKEVWNGVPATVRQTLFEKSLAETFVVSIFGHIALFILIWAITALIVFFGLAPKLFPHPKEKIKDIEFVINGHSRHRRVRHSRIQTQKVLSETPTSPNVEKADVPVPKTTTTNSAKPVANVSKVSKNVSVPSFSMPVPNIKNLSSGLSGQGSGKKHSSSSSGASVGDINNAFSSSGGSSSSDASSNSGFDKAKTKNMISAYDISPYVNELKRNIRWNWKVPKSGKRVDLFLRIAKDGRLIILNVKKTSEDGVTDNAALNAVKKSLPLNPLPAKYAKGYLDVMLVFNANSISSRY